MKQIYFDMQQCEDFKIPYFGEGRVSLPADVILRSKINGYDRQHTDFLQPIGRSVVHLRKEDANSPGWYDVEGW